MLNKYIEELTKIRNNRYQYTVFNKKKFIERKNAICEITNLKKEKSNITKNKCCENYSLKKKLNKNNLLIFYKKFNSHLKLKRNYNLRNFKKISNQDACFCLYIIFFKLIKKSIKINDIHKLNTILKLNDLLSLIYNPNKHSQLTDDFKEMIKYEKNLLKKFL